MSLAPRLCFDCDDVYEPHNGNQKRCRDCAIKRIAPDGLTRDLVLRVHTPWSAEPVRSIVYPPSSLRTRGRMAEPNPGDYLAPVLPLVAGRRRTSSPYLPDDTPIAS